MKLKYIVSLVLAGFVMLFYACHTESLDESMDINAGYGDQSMFDKAPADGNGNAVVIEFDGQYPVECASETILAEYSGWARYRWFGPEKNRNIQLGVFHFVFTFTNSSGETWIWRDVGIDRLYMRNGNLYVSVIGTSTASGTVNFDEVVVGHVIINLTTNEVEFVAGRELGALEDLACNALD